MREQEFRVEVHSDACSAIDDGRAGDGGTRGQAVGGLSTADETEGGHPGGHPGSGLRIVLLEQDRTRRSNSCHTISVCLVSAVRNRGWGAFRREKRVI